MSDLYRKLQLQVARNFVHAYAARDGFPHKLPQVPEQATDAELSGMFRALEEDRATEKPHDDK